MTFMQVPFRLTRDIIDGMGVTGVEGVFRRCCEETLSVMRTNKEALLTIIEVLNHISLVCWFCCHAFVHDTIDDHASIMLSL